MATTGERGGAGLVLAAAVLWGTTGTARALAPAGTSPLSVGAVRIAVGGAALVAVARLRGGLRRGGTWPVGPVVAGTVAVAGYQLAFFSAVARTGVAVGTMVAIGGAPVLAGLLAWVIRAERPGRRWYGATALAVAGGGLLAVAGQAVRFSPGGVALALGAGAAYAVVAVAAKELLAGHGQVEVMAALFAGGAVLLVPVAALLPLDWLGTPRGALVALHLGLVATAAAYVLFAVGLRRVTVATAATMSLAEPLTAAVLGVALLGERLTVAGLAGAALLVAGLVLLAAAPTAAAVPPAATRRRPRRRRARLRSRRGCHR
ncbi:MAG TPA: DMT family transporter [Actinomycetota bacterium]|nr:DMT family transporter [Actinomycetota bacterium]